jgi:hypothetical protein
MWDKMRYMKEGRGGYVGLVVVLMGTLILVFLYVHTYFSPTPQQVVTKTGSLETTTTETALESAQQNIKTAEALQQKLNQQNQEIDRAMRQ